MEYVYAALILHKLKKEISEANITSIIKATGQSANDAQVKALVSALADVNIEEAIKAAPVAVAAATVAAAPAGGGEAKKDEAAAGKSEEQAMEGLASLFG
ncbi:MAG: rpl12p [Candidatus Nitrosotenuis sp.]|nr:rpl12p [Candidatus Nitrosotenuis sp.]